MKCAIVLAIIKVVETTAQRVMDENNRYSVMCDVALWTVHNGKLRTRSVKVKDEETLQRIARVLANKYGQGRVDWDEYFTEYNGIDSAVRVKHEKVTRWDIIL